MTSEEPMFVSLSLEDPTSLHYSGACCSPDSKVGPLKRAPISRINRAFLIIKEGIPDTV